MKKTDEIETVRAIVKSCVYGCLATCENGQPRVRPVSTFMNDDLSFFVAAFSKSRKVNQLTNNPKVELCFVDAHHRQVRVSGVARIVNSVEEKARLMKSYLDPKMWEQFLSGPADPNFSLFKIEPDQVEWMAEERIKYHRVDLGLVDKK